MNKERIFNGYILEKNNKSEKHPCELCDLADECDRLSDELNDIYYCICLDGINDKHYKINNPSAYFRKID